MEEPQSLEETTFDAPQRSQVANRRFKSPEPVGQMMVLAIELGNGKQDNLIIRKGDDAYELASNFVSRNGMDFSVQQFIESQIKLNAQKHQISLKCDAFKDVERPQTASTPSTQDRTSRGHFTPKGKLSPKPVLQNRVTNGNVHERLYQLRKKFVKSKSQSSSIKAPKPKADPDYNYGQWLYLRGSKIKQATLRANKAKKQQNEAKEMVDYTFKPNINRYSVANSPRSPMTVEEHLIQKGIELKGKKKRLRQQKKEIEGKACTFQPNAERKSRVVNKPWALCIQENLLQAFFKNDLLKLAFFNQNVADDVKGGEVCLVCGCIRPDFNRVRLFRLGARYWAGIIRKCRIFYLEVKRKKYLYANFINSPENLIYHCIQTKVNQYTLGNR